jgi:hypothetical protein
MTMSTGHSPGRRCRDGDVGDGDVGDGEVDGDALELPHAASSADTVITEANRTKRIGASFFHME